MSIGFAANRERILAAKRGTSAPATVAMSNSLQSTSTRGESNYSTTSSPVDYASISEFLDETEAYFNAPLSFDSINPQHFRAYLQYIDYLVPLFAPTLKAELEELLNEIVKLPDQYATLYTGITKAGIHIIGWINSGYTDPIPLESITKVALLTKSFKERSTHEENSTPSALVSIASRIRLVESFDTDGTIPFVKLDRKTLVSQLKHPDRAIFFRDVNGNRCRFGTINLRIEAEREDLDLSNPADIEKLYKIAFLKDISEADQTIVIASMLEFFSKNYQQACLRLSTRFFFGKTPMTCKNYLDLQRLDGHHQLSITFRLEDIYISDEISDLTTRDLRLAQKNIIRYTLRILLQETIIEGQARFVLKSVSINGPDASAFQALLRLCTDLDQTNMPRALLKIKIYQDLFNQALMERTQLIEALTAHITAPQQKEEAINAILQHFNLIYFLPSDFISGPVSHINEELLLAEVAQYSGNLAFVLKVFLKKFKELDKTQSSYLTERQRLIVSTTIAFTELTQLLNYLSADSITRRIFATALQPKWLSKISDINDLEIKVFIGVLFKGLNYTLKKMPKETTSPFENICLILANCLASGWPQEFARVLENIYNGGSITGDSDTFKALEALQRESSGDWFKGLNILRTPSALSVLPVLNTMLASPKEQLLYYLSSDPAITGYYSKLISDAWFHPAEVVDEAQIKSFLMALNRSMGRIFKDKPDDKASYFEHICSMLVKLLDPSWPSQFARILRDLYGKSSEFKATLGPRSPILFKAAFGPLSPILPSATSSGLPRTFHNGLMILEGRGATAFAFHRLDLTDAPPTATPDF